MNKYRVILKGFFWENLFTLEVPATSKAHAVKIVSAIYNDCYLRAETTEV